MLAGITSLATSPIAAAILKVDKSQYPQLFDTVVSSSIDSLQSRVAPRESVFDANNFGFNPIASQSFLPYGQSAKIVVKQQQNSQVAPAAQQINPLRYDIRTIHDPNYRVYKAEENEKPEEGEILATLKNNPTVAAYFQPNINVEVNHPLEYRKEELIEKFEGDQNYKQNPYLAGPARIRRYAGGRSKESVSKTESEEDDDPYHYKAEYISKPKAFDESPYSSPYKKKKESEEKYDYPYSYDSGYDHKEYERIKELSEKQAAEIKQNPGNCKEVKKDGMSCMSCKDPKTGGNYESCSYVAEPKNNQYAYSKEKKFDSNDEPEEEPKTKPKKAEKIKESKDDQTSPQKFTEAVDKPYSSYREADKDDSPEKYKSFYIHSSKPKPSEAFTATSDESSENNKPKSYDYNKSIPGFYTDNEPKKDVEHVLAEFKKKDRSACKRVKKNAMTCFQCVDKNGQKNEECMFVSESAPKQSHLAYQELKEFNSKPTNEGSETAESQPIATNAAPAQKSTSSNNGKKLKRKKATQIAAAATSPVAKSVHKVKRSEGSDSESKAKIIGVSNVAPPEEFAGAESKPAFWSETEPQYNAELGVTLPKYMLARSEHEASFDEAVAGA